MSTTAPRRAASPARSPARNNLPFAKADIVLDAVPTPAEIDRALARLEMAAREHGSAVGYRHRAAGCRSTRIAELGEGGRAAAASCWCRSPWWRSKAKSSVKSFARATGNDRCLLRIAALSPLRRHDGAQPRRPRLHRPPHRRPRARRRHACLADAAGRHRRGRRPVQGGAARALRGDQHPLGREARRDRRTGSPTTFRATSSARPGAANIAARSRNGTRCVSPATTARSTSLTPGGGHEPEFIDWRWEAMSDLPDLVVPFKRPIYERVVEEFAKFAH